MAWCLCRSAAEMRMFGEWMVGVAGDVADDFGAGKGSPAIGGVAIWGHGFECNWRDWKSASNGRVCTIYAESGCGGMDRAVMMMGMLVAAPLASNVMTMTMGVCTSSEGFKGEGF